MTSRALAGENYSIMRFRFHTKVQYTSPHTSVILRRHRLCRRMGLIAFGRIPSGLRSRSTATAVVQVNIVLLCVQAQMHARNVVVIV